MDNNLKTTAIVFVLLAVVGCLLVAACSVLFGLGFMLLVPTQVTAVPAVTAIPTPVVVLETPPGPVDTPSSTPTPVSLTTLETLTGADIPENDPVDLAMRLGGVPGPIPESVPAPTTPLSVGAVQSFWATNTDTNESFPVNATLQYITEHTYVWVENGVDFNRGDLEALADDFDDHSYPIVREFFGSERSPGIDNDPRIYILYAGGLGESIAGYFSSSDAVHPLAHEYSNAHEMFFLSADNTDLDDQFTYGVLAHEFQHMVHWNVDRNEEAWINEGFAEVAALLTGYYDGGFDQSYVRDPDLQLNIWPDDGDTIPHYGGSFLFLTYFLGRFGEEATRSLVSLPANGFPAIDAVLAEVAEVDPLHGALPTSLDLFQDFSAALYLLDPAAGDGRYSFPVYDNAPRGRPTETVSQCPTGPQSREVNQFGIDYIRITCRGSFTLEFQGSLSAPLLSVNPDSGRYAFWSNRGDEADMTLTRQFDFRDQSGPLTLEYALWFDIETDYDYVYLVASTDGETWEILNTPSGTGTDPTGNSYGWAYTGSTQGWVQESVDLSRFAGEQVWLRFEYITDAVVNGEGLLLDDVSVPEIGYFSDFEGDDGGWEAQGFVRVENILPQTYRVSLITIGGAGTTVTVLPLDSENRVEVPLDIGSDVNQLVLVVSGTMPYSTHPTPYQFEIAP